MLTRKQARENAFILIFEKSFNNCDFHEISENAKELRNFEIDDYVETVFEGVCNNLNKIDTVISENTNGWKINRISRVVLSLLRLSIYEILKMDEIPNSVSVNEAVIICKKYASEEDAAYLNGILGTVVKKHESGEI